MGEKLKPCPFCGSNKVEVRTDDEGVTWYVFCNYCGVMCGYGWFEDDVIGAWNRRAEQ